MGWFPIWCAWLFVVAFSAALTAILVQAVIAREYGAALIGLLVTGWHWVMVACCRPWRQLDR